MSGVTNAALRADNVIHGDDGHGMRSARCIFWDQKRAYRLGQGSDGFYFKFR